jgi:hypothetical protein
LATQSATDRQHVAADMALTRVQKVKWRAFSATGVIFHWQTGLKTLV